MRGWRNWRSQRVLQVVDPNGQPIDLVLGVAKNQRGRLQRAIGIGDGPSALLADSDVAALSSNLAQSTTDLRRAEGGR